MFGKRNKKAVENTKKPKNRMLGQLPNAINMKANCQPANPPMAAATHKQIQSGERKVAGAYTTAHGRTSNRYTPT